MSNFDFYFPQLRRWLKKRIEQLLSIGDVDCLVLEQMAQDMELNPTDYNQVGEYYDRVQVMTDDEFRRRILQAIKKIEAKKEAAGIC
ncbi:MAG: hypothetical protein KGI27_01790 [Thaumarchaeota archaeon]|nr:hypothetical protein [Nitrososphaerota archaeon]